MKLLSVELDNITLSELRERIALCLRGARFRHVVTVNPEFILEAQDNAYFRSILNKADIREIDGVGVSVGMFLYGTRAKHRLPGVDLVHSVLFEADKNRQRVFLVAHKSGLSSWQKTASVLERQYPYIRFSGANLDPESAERDILKTDANRNDVVLVGLGAPYQEYMIDTLRRVSPGKIKLAMGLGGSFDFITGVVGRAPLWVRRAGFEWLFRLVEQPRRFRREVRKLVLYPLLLLFRELPPPFLKFLRVRDYRILEKTV